MTAVDKLCAPTHLDAWLSAYDKADARGSEQRAGMLCAGCAR